MQRCPLDMPIHPRKGADCFIRSLLSIHPFRRFSGTDVFNDGLAPAIDVRPRAIAHTIAVAGYVHHISAPILRRRHMVVRLLVGNYNEAIATLTQFVQRTAKLRASMRLAVHDSVAQGETT